jgi:predicted alpha/beta-hydrolase family hydrolase
VALWPGAGSSSEHPTLVALAEGLAPLPVARLDFPYRRAGRRAPDRAPVLMASVRAEVDELATRLGVPPGRIVLGGRSMGGRICSMVAAGADGAEPLACAGLVLISYPLHLPGRPERRRVEHLPDVRVPVLSIAGDRDPFGTPEELAEALSAVPGPVTTVTIPGGRHELRGADERIVTAVRSWLGVLPG